MSYEYHLSGSIKPAVLYNKIKTLISESPDYLPVFSDENSSGFIYTSSDSTWGTDIDLSFSEEGVHLEIHAGNEKKLLNKITYYISSSNMDIEIEEV